uniref:Uncharacterized protein n=1 Tax=Cannabis sativa TaxID=3483 RepID=A0A803QAS6_CANSA
MMTFMWKSWTLKRSRGCLQRTHLLRVGILKTQPQERCLQKCGRFWDMELVTYFMWTPPSVENILCPVLRDNKNCTFLASHRTCPQVFVVGRTEATNIPLLDFFEDKLKVKDLVTTELLRQHVLIASFQSIHGVSGRGQCQAPNDLKEQIALDLSVLINKVAKDEELLPAALVSHHLDSLAEEEEI